jgi:hypothetical protein
MSDARLRLTLLSVSGARAIPGFVRAQRPLAELMPPDLDMKLF